MDHYLIKLVKVKGSYMSDEKYNWLYPLALFMLLDIMSTLVGIGFYGMVEQNPFMAQFWHTGNFITIAYLFILGFLALYGVNEWIGKNSDKYKDLAIISMTLFWVVIVTGNTLQIVIALLK